MNTKAQIARLDAEADELEAQAWDKRGEVVALLGHVPLIEKYARYAASFRERAASYRIDQKQAERENG